MNNFNSHSEENTAGNEIKYSLREALLLGLNFNGTAKVRDRGGGDRLSEICSRREDLIFPD